jgi:hypothetical protein
MIGIAWPIPVPWQAAVIRWGKHTNKMGTQLISIMGCVISTPYIRHKDLITAAEGVPGHYHNLDIPEPLLEALEGLKE